MISYIVKKEESGQTLEKYVKKVLPDAPLSVVYKLFRKKDVKVNGHWQDKKYVVSSGESISIYLTDSQIEEFKRKKIDLSNSLIKEWIVYEDKNIILINKPRGVLVQKAKDDDNALDQMVISYLVEKGEYDPNVNNGYVPAPAHRLDRNTEGIVIFGKNLKTLQYLSTVITDKDKIEKKYLTLVKGNIDNEGEISKPLLKKQTHVEVDYKLGKEAVTQYRKVKNIGDYSLVEVKLLTGRTHQIRVHFASINHPVIGDSKYGDFKLNKEIEEKHNFRNQFLSAYKLSFKNLKAPLDNLNGQTFEVKLSNELLDLLKNLGDNK